MDDLYREVLNGTVTGGDAKTYRVRPASNEAAERLRIGIAEVWQYGPSVDGPTMKRLLDEALAAERSAGEREARRATVERIAARIPDAAMIPAATIARVLAEEAAR